jgi:hypothetical protein
VEPAKATNAEEKGSLQEFDRESHGKDAGIATEGMPEMEHAWQFRGHLRETKAAREVVRQGKIKVGAAWLKQLQCW